ncbi:MAG: ion transporter [Bacteroidota bacterium]
MNLISSSWFYKNISRRQFEYFLLFLSVYVVIELYVSSLLDYSAQTKRALETVDFVICIIFLSDFFYGFSTAKNKWHYLKLNWIDFISSIPTIGVLRAGRVFKIFRILRVVRSAKYIFAFFNKKNSFSTLRNIFIFNAVIIFLFTLSFYELEHKANPNISTLGDSLWWTTITTITVGFLQDLPPVTVEGKFLSVVLILLGMIMFSTMIGTITDYFIEDEDIQDKLEKMSDRVDELENKLDVIIDKLDEISKKEPD